MFAAPVLPDPSCRSTCFLNQKGRVETVETKWCPVRQRADRLSSRAEAGPTPQQPVGLGLRRRQMPQLYCLPNASTAWQHKRGRGSLNGFLLDRVSTGDDPAPDAHSSLCKARRARVDAEPPG